MADRQLRGPAVVKLEVPVAQLIERLSGRRHCTSCGSSYHVTQKPPLVEGVCDACQSNLILRRDDRPEVIEQRQVTYHRLTEPVLRHFGNRCRTVVAIGSPEDVFNRIKAAIEATFR
jgi:adenylate kinase